MLVLISLTMSPDHSSHGGLELAQAVQELYAAGQTDYTFEPIVLVDRSENPQGLIEDGDAVIFCCRRGERQVQLTEAFVDPQLSYFPRKNFTHLTFVILTLYHEKFKDLPIAFAPTRLQDTLAGVLSRNQIHQLHIAESEKYAHVTFFFNGGNNQSFPGETDLRIPSPRGIPPDQDPELSLGQVTEQLIQSFSKDYGFIIANFANGDVIGHTQNRQAKIKCAEILDSHLRQVIQAALSANYLVFLTADHGNLELMVTPDGKPHVSHTDNLVPLLLISPQADPFTHLNPGKLADIAPTILSILGLPAPSAMTGRNLLSSDLPTKSNRVLLLILDGWGIGKNDETNPIFLAQTPVWDKLLQEYPHTQLEAAGNAVGLKAGKAGNSEAGHMNIGAGRVVLQDDVRLDAAMQDGSFYTNEVFLQTMEDVKRHHSRLHLIGLLSEKSSHGSVEYPLALLQIAKTQGLEDVFIHIIFDGRSTQPGSAPALLDRLEQRLAEIGIGKIVSGVGRGIALDRDGNYQKTKLAYDGMVFGIGKQQPVSW
jgi:2,3-bisphosphoglycerate-independent phosphoglycerate mutase